MSTKTIEIDADKKGLSEARAFIEEACKRRHVNANAASEAMSLFEAVIHEVFSEAGDESAKLEVSIVSELGRTDIKMVFPGKRFSVHEEDSPDDPDANVIETFSDKLSCSYLGGSNVVRIAVSQSSRAFILPNLIAAALAIVVGLVLSFALDETGRQQLAEQWVAPLENLFTNAVLMVGAPMTLFSLLKNATDSFIVSERNSTSRQLFMTSLCSSVVAVVLATVAAIVYVLGADMVTGEAHTINPGIANWSLASAVDKIIPSNILEPFTTISPVPMIVVALLVVGALVTIGKSFGTLKRAIDACYDLFSGILHIVMGVFPLACFLLFLDVLLADQIGAFLQVLSIAVDVFLCSLLLLVIYALRLKAKGIRVREFARKLWPLVKENFKMGSVIDAVPYNVRYCVENFGFSRERLEKELPVMAQTNLDGNCFVLMFIAVAYILFAANEWSWLSIVVVGFIVLFMSSGSPNQPGSILIGILIVSTYLASKADIQMALCFELFLGGLQNIVNVISGVVTIAENASAEELQQL
ncbi:MAG: cation:dicarboxylase symporter family transporter [Eggerthellaceae bacterium]|nr:cation:dicarboxylase symporter family transporter [Eggerthellaceae bacterium]